MAKQAAGLVINVRASTAKLKQDLGEAKRAFTDFGTHGATGVQATSGALRLLEGNLTSNLRAAERFLANTLKLGPALKAAFPVIGGLAFAGLLAELGKKVTNFVREVQQMPEKIRGSFAQLESSLRITNEGLQVTHDRLMNDIAALQGKP